MVAWCSYGYGNKQKAPRVGWETTEGSVLPCISREDEETLFIFLHVQENPVGDSAVSVSACFFESPPTTTTTTDYITHILATRSSFCTVNVCSLMRLLSDCFIRCYKATAAQTQWMEQQPENVWLLPLPPAPSPRLRAEAAMLN